jgi:hypothetical protein
MHLSPHFSGPHRWWLPQNIKPVILEVISISNTASKVEDTRGNCTMSLAQMPQQFSLNSLNGQNGAPSSADRFTF